MDHTIDIDSFVDDFYLLAVGNDESHTISDENYAHELTLQEAIFSSTLQPSILEKSLTNKYDSQTQPSKAKLCGESSQSKQIRVIICGICMDSKQSHEIFPGLVKCNHVFCMDCITEYITSKIKENIALVECPQPQCKNTIQPENCNNVLPWEVFARWENALCEALILGSEKFYCPYKDCSALMVDDKTETIVEAECPSCRRLFCARCHVNWHAGITCEEFQGLKEDERGSDDIRMMNLAKDKEWRRCSNCNFYVEKAEGCLHMTCRCKFQFCYKCGNKWRSTHSC